MKLFNIFKKETSKEVKSSIRKMDKAQLEKVIGGGDITTPDSTLTDNVTKAKHDAAMATIQNTR